MKQKKLFLFILLISILTVCLNVSAQERYLRPVDEAKQDASFDTFRTDLINAVEKKDKKYLIGVLASDIKVSFGDDNGINSFKKFWKIDKSDSKLWDELSKVLKNGGSFTDEGGTKLFSAPFTYSDFPDDLDWFEYQVIFGENVNLRDRPGTQSKIITTLSYNIVKIEKSVAGKKNSNDYDWHKIKTLGGKTGYVSAEFVRSPIDYRAIFAKRKGKWKIIAFVAGD